MSSNPNNGSITGGYSVLTAGAQAKASQNDIERVAQSPKEEALDSISDLVKKNGEVKINRAANGEFTLRAGGISTHGRSLIDTSRTLMQIHGAMVASAIGANEQNLDIQTK